VKIYFHYDETPSHSFIGVARCFKVGDLILISIIHLKIKDIITNWRDNEERAPLQILLKKEPYMTINEEGVQLLPDLEVIVGHSQSTFKLSADIHGNYVLSPWPSQRKFYKNVRNPGLYDCRVEARHANLLYKSCRRNHHIPIREAKIAEYLASREKEAIIAEIEARYRNELTVAQRASYQNDLSAANLVATERAQSLAARTAETIAFRKTKNIVPTAEIFAFQAAKPRAIRTVEYQAAN
jgi:hypothetical protein